MVAAGPGKPGIYLLPGNFYFLKFWIIVIEISQQGIFQKILNIIMGANSGSGFFF